MDKAESLRRIGGDIGLRHASFIEPRHLKECSGDVRTALVARADVFIFADDPAKVSGRAGFILVHAASLCGATAYFHAGRNVTLASGFGQVYDARHRTGDRIVALLRHWLRLRSRRACSFRVPLDRRLNGDKTYRHSTKEERNGHCP